MTKVRKQRKIKLEQLKPRNPFVEIVMKKAVRKHRNRKKEAKVEYVE